MAIFLNATVAIATARAAGGQENRVRGPWPLRGPTGTMAFLGPPFLAALLAATTFVTSRGAKQSFHM